MFEDRVVARSEAVASIRDLAGDALKRGTNVVGLSIEILDETGNVVETVHASEVLT